MTDTTTSPKPFPSDGLRQLSPKETLQRLDAMECAFTPTTQPSCSGSLYIGMFFDGTKNNKFDDDPKDGHSNVVRLYNTHKDKPLEGRFRFYAPGVGTSFPEIGEYAAALGGSATARGGEHRVNWGLLQVLNAAHRYLANDKPLIPREKLENLVSNLSADQLGFGNSYRRMVLSYWEGKLKELIEKRKPKTIKQINISVFGFSRGAAEARAFCNWFFELCDQKDGGYILAGIPVRIYFLGLFDTVASVGLADAFSNSIIEGHMGWADGNMHIHPAVEQCIHFVAAHEVRACFPLDSVRSGSTYPPNCKEVVYPGAHSDVGGGYKPREQGKCPLAADGKYGFSALIPAIDMYHEARKAGVPLLALEAPDTPPQVKRDFTPAKEVVKAFNAYVETCGIGPEPVEQALKGHMRLYFRYRGSRLQNYVEVAPHHTASEADKKWMRVTNDNLASTLVSMRARRAMASPHSQLLSPDQREILEQFERNTPVDETIAHYFDYYLHDSVAGFASDLNEYKWNGEGHARYRRVFVNDG